MSNVLDELAAVLEERREADPDSSYVASLYHRGTNRILQKVGEEAVETVLAARDFEAGGEREALVGETADLWFHSLVMLTHLGIAPAEVMDELARRFGTSGHAEKAARALKEK